MHSRIWGERLAIATTAIAVGWSVLVACGGVVSGPTAGCFAGAAPVTCNIVEASIGADGPFTLTVNNQAISGNGPWLATMVDLPPGPIAFSGTTSAPTLSITWRSINSTTGGLVQRGSLASSAGPNAEVGPCQVTYRIPAGGPRPQDFRGSFTLATGGNAC